MEKSLRISINYIELRELEFKRSENKSESENNLDLKVNIKDKIKKDNSYQVKVEFVANFKVISGYININGQYVYVATLRNIEDIEEFDQFVEEKKYELAYPMLCKITSLITKMSEEVRIFPLIVPPGAWLEREESEE
ncbi:hypothetical protein [Rummeliibacillus sp. SL167]|uniref:hypothetical protein n=1 Tax=Rummeliibacillus sp. SL167 TaxID=2579792 RepID=UPI0011B609FB|nr:hypothetical protein [Rummeliibacillus sp. SL167]